MRCTNEDVTIHFRALFHVLRESSCSVSLYKKIGIENVNKTIADDFIATWQGLECSAHCTHMCPLCTTISAVFAMYQQNQKSSPIPIPVVHIWINAMWTGPSKRLMRSPTIQIDHGLLKLSRVYPTQFEALEHTELHGEPEEKEKWKLCDSSINCTKNANDQTCVAVKKHFKKKQKWGNPSQNWFLSLLEKTHPLNH